VKVVVTGASGHLGRELVARLVEGGHEVVAVSRSTQVAGVISSAVVPTRLESLQLDLEQDDAVERLRPHLGPEVAIVHLAARQPRAGSSSGERAALLEANVFGTLRVLDAARRENGGAAVVVYACDAEVYGSSPAEEPLHEDAFMRPATDYAVSKLSGEDHLFAFEFEETIRCVSLRFGAFYGPGARRTEPLSALLASAARREPLVIGGHADDRCARVHVRDAARAVELALSRPVSGRFNIADGQPCSLSAAASTVLSICGATQQPTFESSSRVARHLELDLTRARTELGFNASLGLEDALREQWRGLQGPP
jgi:UDP-glucose 4-epimerase